MADEIERNLTNIDVPLPPPGDDQQSNPFSADGELSRKADFIISHSRISRTEVQITDPDTDTTADTQQQQQQEHTKQQVTFAVPETPSEPADTAAANGGNVQQQQQQQSKEELTVQTTSVCGSSSAPSPSSAEKVKLKKKKRCSIF